MNIGFAIVFLRVPIFVCTPTLLIPISLPVVFFITILLFVANILLFVANILFAVATIDKVAIAFVLIVF